MPSILELSTGNYFVARVQSYHVNAPSKKFANVYEFVVTPNWDGEVTLEAVADALGDFHQLVMHDSARIDLVTLSTYVAEEGGYDPTSFINYPTDRNGLRTSVSQPLSAKCVVHVAKIVQTGRLGKAHLRLALFESDVEAPAGEFILSDSEGLDGLYQDALETSGLDGYFGSAPIDIGAKLVMVSSWGSPPVPGSRLVNGITVSGVTVTPTDHKHFNRNG
jgi:hypothetical protein